MMVDGTWIAEGDREVKKALRQDRGVERKRTRDERQVRGRRLHAACEAWLAASDLPAAQIHRTCAA